MNVNELIALITAVASAAAMVTPLVLALRKNTTATNASTSAALAHTEALANHAAAITQAVAAGVTTVATAVEKAEEVAPSTSPS